MSKTYRIGDLATRLSVGVETIRYYEREGLLPRPARSEGNYRLYSTSERERLEFVLHCRALDMTHEEIRNLLRLRDTPEQGCAEVNAVLDAHIGHVADRMRVLRSLQGQLKDLRARCEAPDTSKECGILQGLAAPAKSRVGSRRAGVHAPQRGH
tara:strand:- start:5083 stop:5544 length:462 start_codon:yes stop_codon:yes gene_type:complete